MVKIKICGLKRIEDIEIVNKYLPDYIGFVFADSKRKINFKQAQRLKQNLNDRIKAVGVFVNEKIENIADLINNKTIDIIQLHGDEDISYIKELKEIINKDVKIIKAVRVKTVKDVIIKDSHLFDYLLLDSYEEGIYGGSGKEFDHGLIPITNKKIFIAGGINENNVINIINKVKPYSVDISSGVEINGFKDEQKIKTIIDIIRKEEV